ncbi:putative integral membrane protein [Cryptosporidium felis]|nr:putative integral membrane protein [Cryptosporidium felis]
MQRSSSLIRPLKSSSFVKDKADHRKADDLSVYSSNIKIHSIKKVDSSKFSASKSKKYFVLFILFALLILDSSNSLPGNRNINSGNLSSNVIINSPNENKNRNVSDSQKSISKEHNSAQKALYSKRGNLRRKMTQEEINSEYELELQANPVLKNLGEDEIKEAIENGTIEEAVQEAEEIEEILEEIEENRREKNRGFRGRRN